MYFQKCIFRKKKKKNIKRKDKIIKNYQITYSNINY